jgi:hypothetical protein
MPKSWCAPPVACAWYRSLLKPVFLGRASLSSRQRATTLSCNFWKLRLSSFQHRDSHHEGKLHTSPLQILMEASLLETVLSGATGMFLQYMQ